MTTPTGSMTAAISQFTLLCSMGQYGRTFTEAATREPAMINMASQLTIVGTSVSDSNGARAIRGAREILMAAFLSAGAGTRIRPTGPHLSVAAPRQSRHRAEPAERALVKRDVAAMGARDRAGNRQPKTGSAVVTAAPGVEPYPPLEDALAISRRDARPVVVHRDHDVATHRRGMYRDLGCVATCVRGEVLEHARQRYLVT